MFSIAYKVLLGWGGLLYRERGPARAWEDGRVSESVGRPAYQQVADDLRGHLIRC
jgi:hypothetical protein